jgi:beta-glucosidase
MTPEQAPHDPAFGPLATAESHGPEWIEARVNDLLAQLTLDEKIAVLSGDTPFWRGFADLLAGGYSKHPWVAGAVPRLGIPGIRFTDGPRGAIFEGATTFPVSMARGAAWDVELEERVGDAIGRELRAWGANLFGGVCINLLRHPAWGRAQETYGEDSFHPGMLGAALARGVQRHIMACVKHFACNSMENARFTIDVEAGPRALREIYLAHFKRVVDSGVAAVMSAYNSLNGEWCGQNVDLLQHVLKDTWGFQGFVLSDFIFGMRDAKTAILAGQDLEMPFQSLYRRDLKRLIESGAVPVARIDEAAARILRQQLRFAQGRNPAAYTPETIGCQAHRQLAREVAEKSIVLLRNEGGLLPLRGTERMAVIGRLADVPNTGDGGSSNTHPAYVITPLQGLRERFSNILYDDGAAPARAAATAAGCDVALVVVGYTHRDEGEFVSPGPIADMLKLFPAPTPEEAEAAQQATGGGLGDENAAFSAGGDRLELTLRPEDEALILAVAAANPRTVVAVMSGSAVITEAWRERVPAILMLWYPGMEGGRALANILLGDVNPAGRLPCTFPRRSEDLPQFDREAASVEYDLWHGYRKLARDGRSAAFPFGFGLSYTAFEYQALAVEQDRLRAEDTIRAAVTVKNTGTRAGSELVQLYVAAPESRVERAPRELKAFARLALEPGETGIARLGIPVAELAYYDERSGWVLEPGRYTLFAARHAADPAALAVTIACGLAR